MIGDVRGLGPMLAMELGDRPGERRLRPVEETIKLRQEALRRGLIILPAGLYFNCVRFLPPLNISTELIDEGIGCPDRSGARHRLSQAKEVAMSYPSVYPTGATVYDPEACWNGYTIYHAKEVGALLIDMNGGRGAPVEGAATAFPHKILPGGYVMGHSGERNTRHSVQDYLDLVQVDWEGNVVWRFDEYEFIEGPGGRTPAGWPASTTTTSVRAIRWATMRPAWIPSPRVATPSSWGHKNLVCPDHIRQEPFGRHGSTR